MDSIISKFAIVLPTKAKMSLLKKLFLYGLAASIIFLLSCEKESINITGEVIEDETDTENEIDSVTLIEADTVIFGFSVPEKYLFVRDADGDGVNDTTVSFDGQSTRLKMAVELIGVLKDTTASVARLTSMFAHEEGVEDFLDVELNTSSKQIRNKIGANTGSAVDTDAVRTDVTTWMTSQVNDVFPNWSTEASSGVAGKIQEAGGGANRYVNAYGLELDQAVSKALIGAFVADQVLNGYLTPTKLDEGTNRAEQSSGSVLEGKAYTNMEHYWDEGYGYVYGLAEDGMDPVTTPGSADKFLLKYIEKVDDDTDFTGIASRIFDAFKLGRVALVVGDYITRDEAAKDIMEEISKVIAIRAAHYLKAGQEGKAEATPDMASVFHDLSEGYGFLYSLQFTYNPETGAPYFTRAEVLSMLDKVYPTSDDQKGFWEVTPEVLEAVATEITTAFGFTYENA